MIKSICFKDDSLDQNVFSIYVSHCWNNSLFSSHQPQMFSLGSPSKASCFDSWQWTSQSFNELILRL